MKILATSDLHGQLIDPQEIPPCGLLIIAGDVAPYHNHSKEYQRSWFELDFAQWLTKIPATYVVGIGGNHDYALQNNPYMAKNLPWHYLQDDWVKVNGVNIYGIPWVPNLPRWAFHANDQTLAEKYKAVPTGTDILVSHGPPNMIADLSSPKFGSNHCGHKAVNQAILRVQPKLVVCGHIHESHGIYKYNQLRTRVCNVARLDDDYKPVYPMEDLSEYA